MNNVERDKLIMEKLNSGISLSDLQKLLNEEYGIRMTYLDLRLLASTLQVEWEKQDKPKRTAPQPQSPQAPAPQDADDSLREEDAEEPVEEPDEVEDGESGKAQDGEGAKTLVTLDETPMRGAALSGHVTFMSGAAGKWMMNRQGQLGIAELDEGSEKPTQEDIQSFQEELQKILEAKSADLQKAAFDGKTQVEISPVLRPGCELNGTVQFASGAKGEWMLAGGKLDFDLEEGSSKPTREDLNYFQMVLTQKLREKGYGG